MKVKPVKCVDPSNDLAIRYRLMPFYSYKVTLDDMAKNISRSSSVNKADVMAVVDALKHELISHVTKGGIVEFDGLGSFRLSVSSVIQETAELTSVSDIQKKKVVFRIDHKLRSQIEETKFEKISDKNTDKAKNDTNNTEGEQ